MLNAKLKRLRSNAQGTFGSFALLDTNSAPIYSAFSLELPWRNNAKSVSCVPATAHNLPPGLYTCRFTWSPRFKRRMYLIEAPYGRTGIRIHSANLAGDVKLGFRAQLNGCIALGKRIGVLDGQAAVLSSAPAVYELERLLGGQTFTLEIF